MIKLERISHVSIIAASGLLVYVLLSQYVFKSNQASVPSNTRGSSVGHTLSIPNVHWEASEHSLVLVLSSSCTFCVQSAPFYQKLAAEKVSGHLKTRFVAVMAENSLSAASFLDKSGISVDQIATVQLSSIGFNSTPTLLLVDKNGKILKEWDGKLNPSQELQVIAQLT